MRRIRKWLALALLGALVLQTAAAMSLPREARATPRHEYVSPAGAATGRTMAPHGATAKHRLPPGEPDPC